MVSLPDGEKISKISLFVLAQLRNVTDGRTDGQTTDRHRVTEIAALCIASHGKKTKQFRAMVSIVLVLVLNCCRRAKRTESARLVIQSVLECVDRLFCLDHLL